MHIKHRIEWIWKQTYLRPEHQQSPAPNFPLPVQNYLSDRVRVEIVGDLTGEVPGETTGDFADETGEVAGVKTGDINREAVVGGVTGEVAGVVTGYFTGDATVGKETGVFSGDLIGFVGICAAGELWIAGGCKIGIRGT
ncbi:hypothetical protein EUTSA_v10015399mg, partial [Eutrema salsugineum]